MSGWPASGRRSGAAAAASAPAPSPGRCATRTPVRQRWARAWRGLPGQQPQPARRRAEPAPGWADALLARAGPGWPQRRDRAGPGSTRGRRLAARPGAVRHPPTAAPALQAAASQRPLTARPDRATTVTASHAARPACRVWPESHPCPRRGTSARCPAGRWRSGPRWAASHRGRRATGGWLRWLHSRP